MTPPAAGTPPCDAVLLAGFGGPTGPDEVMPFLRRVVEGRGIPEARLREVAHHYECFGGRSPYNELTHEQADRLRIALEGGGPPLPVYVGLRHAEPSFSSAIRSMQEDGRRCAAVVALAAHRCEASWDRYRHDVARALRDRGADGLTVRWIDPWFDEPGFLEACAARCEEAVPHRRGAWPSSLPLLFTAHSIPMAMPGRAGYVEECLASCRGVASILGAADWTLAWQSRSGPPHVPWLEPDIVDVIRERARGGMRACVVQAIGFLSDHVEVLYDLDVEAAGVARELGVAFHRAPCVNAHPDFIAAIARKVRALDAKP